MRDTAGLAAAMYFSGGAGGGGECSYAVEMYQSARRLLLSARDGMAGRIERLASAPMSSSYSSSVPLVGAVDPAGAEGVQREVAQIKGGNSDGHPIPSMRCCPTLFCLCALQQGTPIMSVGHRMLHRPRSLSASPPRSMHFLVLAVIVGSPVRLFVSGLLPAASVEDAWELLCC